MLKERFQIGEYWLSVQHNSPVWKATWYDTETRQTRRASLGTKDFQAAKIALAEYAVKNSTPSNQLASETALAHVLVRYWELHAKNITSSVQARIALGLWSDFWTNAVISDLTIPRQKEFMYWLKERGYKNSYVSRVLSVGRSAILRAYKWGELDRAPFILNEADRSDENEPYLLDDFEMHKLLVTSRSTPHLHMFVMIMLNTLSRPSAALELSPAQVNFKDRLIALNPKGRKQTNKFRPVVPLTTTLEPLLRGVEKSRFVLWHEKPVKSVRKTFAALVKSAGLSYEITPYSLRHTMATELRKRGVSAWEVEGMLGHRRPGMTEKYARFQPDYGSQSRQTIDAFFKRINFSHHD